MVQNNARAQPVQLRVHTVPIGALKYDYRSENKARRKFKKKRTLQQAGQKIFSLFE